jgi:hypothetical protein
MGAALSTTGVLRVFIDRFSSIVETGNKEYIDIDIARNAGGIRRPTY